MAKNINELLTSLGGKSRGKDREQVANLGVVKLESSARPLSTLVQSRGTQFMGAPQRDDGLAQLGTALQSLVPSLSQVTQLAEQELRPEDIAQGIAWRKKSQQDFRAAAASDPSIAAQSPWFIKGATIEGYRQKSLDYESSLRSAYEANPEIEYEDTFTGEQRKSRLLETTDPRALQSFLSNHRSKFDQANIDPKDDILDVVEGFNKNADGAENELVNRHNTTVYRQKQQKMVDAASASLNKILDTELDSLDYISNPGAKLSSAALQIKDVIANIDNSGIDRDTRNKMLINAMANKALITKDKNVLKLLDTVIIDEANGLKLSQTNEARHAIAQVVDKIDDEDWRSKERSRVTEEREKQQSRDQFRADTKDALWKSPEMDISNAISKMRADGDENGINEIVGFQNTLRNMNNAKTADADKVRRENLDPVYLRNLQTKAYTNTLQDSDLQEASKVLPWQETNQLIDISSRAKSNPNTAIVSSVAQDLEQSIVRAFTTTDWDGKTSIPINAYPQAEAAKTEFLSKLLNWQTDFVTKNGREPTQQEVLAQSDNLSTEIHNKIAQAGASFAPRTPGQFRDQLGKDLPMDSRSQLSNPNAKPLTDRYYTDPAAFARDLEEYRSSGGTRGVIAAWKAKGVDAEAFIEAHGATLGLPKSYTPLERRINTTVFKEEVAKRESTSYTDVNTYGFIGRYQFGVAALEDMGLVKPGTSKSKLGNRILGDPSVWIGGMTKERFLSNPSLQDSTFDKWTTALYNRAVKLGKITPEMTPEQVSNVLLNAHQNGVNAAPGTPAQSSAITNRRIAFPLG